MSRAKQSRHADGEEKRPARRPSRTSLDRKIREQEKELSTLNESRRRKRAAAKDVYNAIGFDAMYRDGICQVEEGLFSQTIAFEDISYQSAREENQQAIFSAYCQLFDYFGAESCVQLSVVEHLPIPAIGRSAARCPSRPTMRTPRNTRANTTGYSTTRCARASATWYDSATSPFATGAKDVDAAVPKLARMRTDAIQTLNKIRSGARVLDGEERLRAINSVLRPGKPFTFSWEQLGPKSGLRTKDFVCPTSLDFKPEGLGTCYLSEGAWCQVLAFTRFGSELTDRCLADVIDLPMPLNVTLHIQAMDKAKAVAFVKKRLAWMDKEIIDEQMSAVKKGYDFQILPSELKYSKEEAEDLLDHLQNKNQRLFVYTGLVFTWAATRKELDDQVLQIVSTGRRNSIEIGTLDYRQRQGMNSVLPLGHNHVEVSRMMTTAQVAIQMPFATQELAQDGGGYYGQNKQSSNLVLCNRKHLASPMGFVAGKPGSGKSFSVKREIENTILAYPEDEIIILDPAGEYSPVVTGNGGESIRFAPDSGTHLNPFDLSDVAHQSTAAQMAFKIDASWRSPRRRWPRAARDCPRRTSPSSPDAWNSHTHAARTRAGCPCSAISTRYCASSCRAEARDIALRYERYGEGRAVVLQPRVERHFRQAITNI